MADWFNITEAMTDPFAPGTSELWKAWWKNPIAITEGATGAPRIVGAAMYPTAVGAVVLRKCTPIKGASSETAAADIQHAYSSYFTAMVACNIRLTITCNISVTGGGIASITVWKNDVSFIVYTTSQTNTAVSLSLVAGDSIAVTMQANGGPSGTASATITKLEYSVDTRSAVMT